MDPERAASVKLFLAAGIVAALLAAVIGCGGGGGEEDVPLPPPPPAFSTADLAGTWTTYAVSVGGYFPGVIRGTMVLNNSGQVLSGSATRYGGDGGGAVIYSYGTLALNDNGIVSGSVRTGNETVTIISGKMKFGANQKNLFAWVDSTSQGQFDMGIALKVIGGTVFPWEIAGSPWPVFAVSSGGSNLGVMAGSIFINQSGFVTGGTITRYSSGGGGSATYTGGRFYMVSDNTGVFSGTVSTDRETVSVPQGTVDYMSSVLASIDNTSQNQFDMSIGIRRSADPFFTSELAGTWYLYGASNGGTSTGVTTGTLILNGSGQVIGGSATRYALFGGGSALFTGGLVTLAADGIVAGSVATTRETIFIDSAKMDPDRKVISWISHTNLGEYSFGLLIKGT